MLAARGGVEPTAKTYGSQRKANQGRSLLLAGLKHTFPKLHSELYQFNKVFFSFSLSLSNKDQEPKKHQTSLQQTTQINTLLFLKKGIFCCLSENNAQDKVYKLAYGSSVLSLEPTFISKCLV